MINSSSLTQHSIKQTDGLWKPNESVGAVRLPVQRLRNAHCIYASLPVMLLRKVGSEQITERCKSPSFISHSIIMYRFLIIMSRFYSCISLVTHTINLRASIIKKAGMNFAK